MTTSLPQQVELNLAEYDIDEGDLETYVEFVPAFLAAINKGLLDSNIRQIARTCFVRRDAILDGGERPITETIRRASTATSSSQNVLKSITSVPDAVQGRTFTYKGKHYRKNDLRGKIVVLHDPRPRRKVDGLRVRVTGVQSRIKVEWIDKPRDKKLADAPYVFFTLDFIAHVLN